MAKRDPVKTARNKEITRLTNELDALWPLVEQETGIDNRLSFHAIYGGKHDKFMDIRHEIISSPDEFVSLWMQGFMRCLDEKGPWKKDSTLYQHYLMLVDNPNTLKYVVIFLERTYLRNIEALSRKRPNPEEAIIWIGQERASYGILVTPRFNGKQWENDGSEIRHFKPNYWTIGHILETGLAVPFEDDIIEFESVEAYLSFFRHTLVRASGSPHEKEIAKRYADFVKSAENPTDIPLLIPEIRYDGIAKKHEHRLDFCVIDPHSLAKVGFELSPWSTHGMLTGTKEMTQKAINEKAQGNFEKEMKKLKDYFRRYNIPILVYTDTDLRDYDQVFSEISKYLNPERTPLQLKFQVMKDFMEYKDQD